ncbi:MAG: F0F1 ATP synthase subunit B [Cyanobacteria bacterium RI_101]|nr:F0F1 ATP synthase subunit B [Cyanobacteria bacterium RI_101]
MLNSWLILATEEGGFGLNLDFWEANLFNLAILLGIVIYFAPKTLGKILGERRSKIAEALTEAETRQKTAAQTLAQEQEKLAQAQAEAERIRSGGAQRAETAKAEILAQAQIDVQRLRESAAKDLGAERERVIGELKRRIAALALEKAESDLRGRLSDNVQDRLIERSIAQLGGR